ncbi:tryptophan--tRNA ligase, mitochondrial [Anoplophora glabripennis]|uniref:tryptophan--tRNA ligase, mitochondrial n=1 Tax=Anoplophora glabripennis TaxID=217634 RepID=UPI00087355FC|nr:tryptophan--tRNA ligase, mitochondrial [Anoplophora glabripennis]
MLTRNILRKGLKHAVPCKLFSTVTSNVTKAELHPRRIFSGIQPTGAIHLGNYLGAIAQWVKFQQQNEDMILSIVDLHAMTIPHEPKKLSENVMQITATLLACGIDPEKVILFQQSAVPAHTELCWCLGCVSTMARLGHLPQYKEKSRDMKDIPLGLFVYPVLQTADILLYKATHVPVGEDQVQQIQLAQELARMFNNRFGDTFPVPHSIVTGTKYARLRSLRDPDKKMSKSDSDPKSRICLTDKPDDIVRNIKKAVTDFTSEVTYDLEERPGVSNLISIHSFITSKTVDEICEEAKGLSTGQYKMVVADAVVSYINPIREKILYYLSEQQYLLDVLRKGSEKAVDISERNMEEVRYKLGLKFHAKSKDKIKLNVS